MATKTILTLGQFERLPDDDLRHELDEGELLSMSPAARKHGNIQAKVTSLLESFVGRHSLGDVVTETGFVLGRDPDTARAPDVAFIRAGRPAAPAGFEEGAPDLAIEIVSPSDTAADMAKEVSQYRRAGARAAWVVYQESKQVHVFEAGGEACVLEACQTISAGDLLPGFSVPVSTLFE